MRSSCLANTEEFIGHILKYLPAHSHLNIAIRVFECIDYIRDNLDEISSHAGQTELLRHPKNHLSFHLNGLETQEEAKEHFTQLLSEIDSSLAYLLSLDDSQRSQAISVFLNHINDSVKGCMEARLRPALSFVGTFQSSGLLSLNNLMEEVYGKVDEDIPVEKLLEFFGDKVEHHIPVIDAKGEVVPLTWPLIHDYIENIFGQEIRKTWLEFAEPDKFWPDETKDGYFFYFNNKQITKSVLTYIKSLLPEVFESSIAKVEIQENNYFFLSKAQYNAYRYVIARAKSEKSIDPDDKFAWKVADKFWKEGALIKAVRWDKLNFHREFMMGVTKSPENQAKEAMREGKHEAYTVYASGVYDRNNKPAPYLNFIDPDDPDHIEEEKKKRSKFQPTSLVTSRISTPVFIHHMTRESKQVGYIFNRDDAMINRIFRYDRGTRFRPYEFETYEAALAYYSKAIDPVNPLLFNTLEELEQYCEDHADKYNEVLACLRFDINTSAVGIYSDTFEARCIAQSYAAQMKARLKQQYAELGQPWDDNYEVPMIYYIPGSEKNWMPYTQAEQLADRNVANQIFNDEVRRERKLNCGDVEFLLLIDNPEVIFQTKTRFAPLIDRLLLNSEFHVVESLLSRVDEQTVSDYFAKTSFSSWQDIFYGMQWAVTSMSQWAAHWTIGNGYFVDLLGLILSFKENKSEMTSLLHRMVEQDNPNFKTVISNSEFDLNHLDGKGRTLLHAAAANGRAEQVKILLADSRVDVNAEVCEWVILGSDKKTGVTALHLAAICGHVETFKLLLADERINFYAKDKHGHSALFYAIEYGHVEIIKLLLEDKRMTAEMINAKNELKESAFTYAVKSGNIDAVKLLQSDSRVDVNSTSHHKETAIHIAARMKGKNKTKILNLLLANPAVDINAMDDRNRCVLEFLIMDSQAELVESLLVDKRINSHSISQSLIAVIKEDKLDFIDLIDTLLAHPLVDINAIDDNGETALMHAAENNNEDLFLTLLNDPRRNSLSVKNKSGWGALESACFNQNTKLVRAILSDTREKINLNKIGNVRLTDEIKDLIVWAKVERYERKLQERKTFYDPKYPAIHKCGFFGYSKPEKSEAIQAARTGIGINNQKTKAALKDGKLGDITSQFSPVTKLKLGL